MPIYEITVYYKPLAKEMLVEAVKRTTTFLLSHGAVITDLKSLGYRDLPVRQVTKLTKEQVFTANSMLFNTSMSRSSLVEVSKQFHKNLDVIKVGIVNADKVEEPPKECDLEALLKPPAYRKSVEELRKYQKMGHFMALKVYKRTEKEFKNVPKSYFVAPIKR